MVHVPITICGKFVHRTCPLWLLRIPDNLDIPSLNSWWSGLLQILRNIVVHHSWPQRWQNCPHSLRNQRSREKGTKNSSARVPWNNVAQHDSFRFVIVITYHCFYNQILSLFRKFDPYALISIWEGLFFMFHSSDC